MERVSSVQVRQLVSSDIFVAESHLICILFYRRALKVVSSKDQDRPDTQNDFKKRLGMWKWSFRSLASSSHHEVQGIEARTAGQLWNRLEKEGRGSSDPSETTDY